MQFSNRQIALMLAVELHNGKYVNDPSDIEDLADDLLAWLGDDDT